MPAGSLMAYSAAAAEHRVCLGTRKDGQECRAWAVWDDPRQLCMTHSGRHHTGPHPSRAERRPEKPTQYQPCHCRAYAWPHRPGGGICRWPDPPTHRLTTPAGTHGKLRGWRRRPPWG